MHRVVVSLNPTAMPNSAARVCLDDLLLHLAVQVRKQRFRRTSSWRRLISGSCSASSDERRVHRARSAVRSGITTVSSVGGASADRGCARAGLARGGLNRARRTVFAGTAPIASPIRIPVRPQSCPIWPALIRSLTAGPPRTEDADAGDPALPSGAERHPVADRDRAGEHPHERHLLPGRTTVHLEHQAGHRAIRVAAAGRQQRAQASHQRGHAGAGDGRPEVDRMDRRASHLRAEFAAQVPCCEAGAVHDGGEHPIAALGELLSELGTECGIAVLVRHKARNARAFIDGPAHRDDGRGEPGRDLRQHAGGVGAPAVDLVHENQGRDAQPLQRAHQHPGLRLHPLDRGDHQDGAVEHGEDALDLRDEVRVAGGVDDADVQVAGARTTLRRI